MREGRAGQAPPLQSAEKAASSRRTPRAAGSRRYEIRGRPLRPMKEQGGAGRGGKQERFLAAPGMTDLGGCARGGRGEPHPHTGKERGGGARGGMRGVWDWR